MRFKIYDRALLQLLTLLSRAVAQHHNHGNTNGNNSNCYDPDFQTYNATGSITIQGFQPPFATNLFGPLPTGSWTINTAIKDFRNYTTNTTYTEQTFWIDTNPFVNLSSSELAYAGCALILYPNPASTTIIVPGTDESGCQSVFDSDCYNAIVTAVNNTGNFTGHRRHADCSNFFTSQNFPSECQGQWSFEGIQSRGIFTLFRP